MSQKKKILVTIIFVITVCATILILDNGKSLVLEVGDAFLWDILMVERVGSVYTEKKEFFNSRDVLFYEDIFMFT